MMKKLLAVFGLFLFMQHGSNAQMGAPKAADVAKVKARPMIVVLREEDPDLVKKYQKNAQQLKEYKNEITTYNERIQKVAPQMWKFNPELTFKPASEVAPLLKSKSKEYAIIDFTLQKVKENSTLEIQKGIFRDDWVTPILAIRLTEKSTIPNGLVTFLSRNPSEGDLALALMQLQAQYVGLEKGGNLQTAMKENAAQLKTKTLVIDKTSLKPGLTEQNIKSAYPHTIEIADKTTIDKYILEQNPKYAVVYISPIMGMEMLSHVIVDLGTGNILGFAAPGSLGSGQKAKDAIYITKESLASYTKGFGK